MDMLTPTKPLLSRASVGGALLGGLALLAVTNDVVITSSDVSTANYETSNVNGLGNVPDQLAFVEGGENIQGNGVGNGVSASSLLVTSTTSDAATSTSTTVPATTVLQTTQLETTLPETTTLQTSTTQGLQSLATTNSNESTTSSTTNIFSTSSSLPETTTTVLKDATTSSSTFIAESTSTTRPTSSTSSTSASPSTSTSTTVEQTTSTQRSTTTSRPTTTSSNPPANTTTPTTVRPVVIVRSTTTTVPTQTTQTTPSQTTQTTTASTIANTTTSTTTPVTTTTSVATTTTRRPTTTLLETTSLPTTTTTTRPTTTASTTTTTVSGPRLIFAEEFDTFNSAIWSKEHSTYGDGNNELQCYTPEQVSVSNGKLVIKAESRSETCPNGSTRAVTSGMVRSRGVSFSPGQRIEYRVKLTPNDRDNQGGLWPALWSSGWSSGGGWPYSGEWDGFEVMTARDPMRSVYSIHYQNTAGNHGKKSREIFRDTYFSDSWHTMAFNYGHNGVLEWFFDGELVHRVTDADTKQAWPSPFDESMKEFKINMALGGSPGPLDPRALPATYEVDYLRIYQID